MNNQSKAKKPVWRDVKQHLSTFDRTALIGLVQDLYKVNKTNQIFLHSRFNLGDDNLKPYKEIIERWVCPNIFRNQDISISKAKKAISEYRKAVGSPEGMTELSIFYCESCIKFLNSCGLDDESYYYALVLMLEQTIKYMRQLPTEQQATYLKRLDKICRQIYKGVYGFALEEDVEILIYEYDLIDKIGAKRSPQTSI